MKVEERADRRRPLTRAQQRARAAWVFSSVLLAVLVGAVAIDRRHLAGVGHPILAVLAGLLAGLMTFFLSGDLGIQLAWLKAGSGMGAFVLVLLLWPRLLPSAGLYQVQVTIAGPTGEAVPDAEVSSMPPGVKKRFDRGWELDIPVGSLADDHRLILYAEDPQDGARARVQLTLGTDLKPAVEIRLPATGAPAGLLRGQILDDRTGKPLAGVLVTLPELHLQALTDQQGQYRFEVAVPGGQQLRLRAYRDGYEPLTADPPAAAGFLNTHHMRRRR